MAVSTATGDGLSLAQRLRPHLADILGLAVLLWMIADTVRPGLLFVATIPAGGDMPCHYPTFAWLRERLLPELRLHGWYPGAYLGHPVLLYYFPLPFVLMAGLSLVFPPPVAFKLGAMGGVFLLPLLTFASFRLMRFRAPAPLLAAAGAVVFLFVEENPIWGGTLASTLTGELSYTYGLGLAVLFLGVAYRAYGHDRSFWGPAALLALTALAHGYAVLWAGLSITFFFYASRRPLRTFAWTAAVGGAAFALAAFWLLPLLADWRFTTPYSHPYVTVGFRNYAPPLLWIPGALALAGIAWTLLVERRVGGPDHRLLYLGHAALVALALALAGPALGIVGFRFAPFAHAVIAMLGGACVGLALTRFRAPGLVALAVVLVTVVAVDARTRHVRRWAQWSLSGLEARELWPPFAEVAERLRGTVADPRVAVEYGAVHERAGSIRMYETLPFFSGRSTLEGVYNQASLSTHPVYYVASELGPSAPNPFRERYYSGFDTDAALAHLRLFNTRDVVAVSTRLVDELASRPDAALVARVPPYTLFRLDGTWRYVTPMTHAPVRSSPRGWRDKAYRWFTRRPLSPAHLVFTDDPRFEVVDTDEYLAPRLVPLPEGVSVEEQVEAERITIRTSRVGHPLLVKVSYHPRWKAAGARGPYLVSPSLMMVLPEQETVVLEYTRTWADWTGLALTAAALAAAGWWRFGRRPVVSRARLSLAALACDHGAAEPRRWGAAIPITLLALLALSRLGTLAGAADDGEATRLHALASRAYQEQRYEAAVEYLRNALLARPTPDLRRSLLALRADSLFRAGRSPEAHRDWRALADEPAGAYTPQALFGVIASTRDRPVSAEAVAAAGRLVREYPDNPWTLRLMTEFRDLARQAASDP